jgi:outer membrane lipoprotein-sorting protein
VRRLAAGALVVAALSGCASHRVSGPDPTLDASLPSAAELLASIAQRRQRIHTLRTLARLTYTSPTERRHAKQIILAARPDRLRFEVLSPFGPIFVLATSAGRLAAYAREEATVYRGTASPANLERYTSVELPITAAIDLLLGTPRLDGDPDPVVSRDAGAVRLLCDGGDRTARVMWFTPQRDPARFERWAPRGDVVLRATFSDYVEVNGFRMPLQLSLETPATQRRIDIEFREPEINAVLDAPLFALDTPRGSKEVDLDQVIN